jgi:translation initiation factor IF-3
VIDEDGKQLGVMPPYEALKVARGKGLDLVEVSPTAAPPVCRIINYGKYLYQLSKRQHEARKHQKSIELKEVKFRPRTGEHDYETKRNKILQFLEAGDKVKATIMFRGREMAHRDLGWKMMQRLVDEVAEHGLLETRPKQEGPNLSAVIAPKKIPGKGSQPRRPASSSSSVGPAPAGKPASPPAVPPVATAATSAPVDPPVPAGPAKS